MTMRILHVAGSLNRGGAETWLVQMLKHIDREKYRMDFLVHSIEPGAYDEEVRALGSRILPCPQPGNPLRYAWNFRRILLEHGPYDCVHSHLHHYSGLVLALAATMRLPMRIAHSHNDTRAVDRASSPARRAYLAAMRALIRRFATRGIAVSENAAASLFSEAWRLDSRWSLCPLGIDLEPFAQAVNAPAVRTQLGIAPDALVIGHVGRFFEQKNHRFIVRIAESLCAIEPRALFLLVGDGPLRGEIEALVKERGLTDRFVFAGVRPDVPRIMKGAMDCFLFPSLYEGVGLVLWEAQAAGLPTIASGAVPREACLAPELFSTVPLSAPPEYWADVILARARQKRRSSAPETGLKCSLNDSLAALLSVYGADAAANGRAAHGADAVAGLIAASRPQ